VYGANKKGDTILHQYLLDTSIMVMLPWQQPITV